MSELTHKEVFDTLLKVDVSKHTDEINLKSKAGKAYSLTYLNWAKAWQLLMGVYPQAEFTFVDYDGISYRSLPDGTAEVTSIVTIGNVTRTATLPVMNSQHNPIVNPDARQVNDSRMRCLVKNLALLGLGISVFSQMKDDLPDPKKDEEPEGKKTPPKKATATEQEPKEEPKEEPKDEPTKEQKAEAFVEGFSKLLVAMGTESEVDGLIKKQITKITAVEKYPALNEKLSQAIDAKIKSLEEIDKEVSDD